jgi:broad specificity phosphatase PhoE
MTCVLFRHGDKNYHSADPDLSSLGHRQAALILQQVQENKLPVPQALFVSPKKRTQQTMQPLSEHLKIPLKLAPELLERQASESFSQFSARVQKWIQFCEKSNTSFYFCSHMDWIDEFLTHAACDQDLQSPLFQSWAPAAHMVFQIQDGLWHLEKFGQILV